MSVYKKAKVQRLITADSDGDYRLPIETSVHGSFVYDPGRCTFIARLDGKELFREQYAWQDGKVYRHSFTQQLKAGDHYLSFEIEPLSEQPPSEKKTTAPTPAKKQSTFVDVRIVSVKFQGPLDPKHWSHPKNYDRFFTKDEPPPGDAERREYAREVLGRFATLAFRRPVDAAVRRPAGGDRRADLPLAGPSVRTGSRAGDGGGARLAAFYLPGRGHRARREPSGPEVSAGR